MWSPARRRAVVVALGLAAVLGSVAATRAAMPCVTLMGSVTRLPPCCAEMERTDRVAVPGSDCCQNGRLEEHTPAQSPSPSASAGPASYVIVPAAHAPVTYRSAVRQAHGHGAVERPPPLDSPSQGTVLII